MLNLLRTWLNLDEIELNPVLQLYGLFLALSVPLATYTYYAFNQAYYLSLETTPACWPWFQSCESYRFHQSIDVVHAFLAVGSVGVLASALYGVAWLTKRKHWVLTAHFVFILAFALKAGLLSLDSRYRHNQTLMEFYVVLFFLFGRQRKTVLKLMAVGFYFTAAFLKFDPDWLSGLVLRQDFWFFPSLLSRSWVSVACRYVLVLELFLIWGLFSRRKWIFWIVIAQLVAFHLLSYSVVGSYYPILMGLILSVFVLDRWHESLPDFSVLRSLVRSPRLVLGNLGLFWIVVYAFNQIWPRLLPGDLAITGEGRNFGLYMFRPTAICESRLYWVRANGQTEEMLVPNVVGNFRDQCDPMMHRALVKNYCTPNLAKPGMQLNWIMKSRRESSPNFETIVDLKNFCENDPGYRIFGHNEWIKTAKPGAL